jgi:predicted DNA-binding transcriptional regulator AlpA
MDRLLDFNEVLRATGYRSRTTLRRLNRSGILPVVRLSKRALRIKESDLDAFIRARSGDKENRS